MIRPRAVPRAPSLLTCLFALLVADLALRVRGLGRTVRLARWLAGGPGPARPTDAGVIAATTRRVALAGTFYPRRALCLEQSICLYVLLARRGVPAALRIGVHTLPFRAHSWVEYEGRPINEPDEVVRSLTPFPSFEH
jgi:hypothetical protein